MKNLTKFTIAILVALITTSNLVLAEVNSATLSVTARPVDFPEVTLLSLNYRVRLNEEPTRRCSIRLFGTVSEIGNESATPIRRLLATKKILGGSRRLITFKYYGRAISGTELRQTQGNFQARVKCVGGPRVTSNTEATNLTCNGGVEKSSFLNLLKAELR